MYPRNNASPERIAVGQVVLIADGTVQSSGVAVTVRGQGGAEASSAGTIAYGADSTVYYTPTQAETDFTSFVLIASKASCFSVSQTIITSAASTAGEVVSDAASRTASQATGFSTFDHTSDAVILPAIPNDWITSAGIAAGGMDGKGNWNVGKTGYTLTQTFPANFASMTISGAGIVDSLTQGFLNGTLTEATANRINTNFDTFFENGDAATTKIVDDVGGGGGGGSSDWTASELNEIRGRLGITGTTAAGGNTPTLATASALSTVDAIVDIILASTDELQSDWADGGRLDLILDSRMAEASINTTAGAVDTVTDAVITATVANKIADHILRRAWANAEASSDGDTVSFRSLLGAVAKLVNRVGITGTDLLTYRDDDSTVLGTQALTTDASADPITGIDTT